MANVVINIGSMDVRPGDVVHYDGDAVLEGASRRIQWSIDVPVNSLPETVSATIRDAVVAEATKMGITVGALDAKILYGGGSNL